MRNILFNRHSSKLGLLGSLVAVVVVALVLALVPQKTNTKTLAENCVNPPTTPTLNHWPVTYDDENTPLCHDFPAIDAAVRPASGSPVFSQNEADWNNGLQLNVGQEGVALMYVHNGAANNLPAEQTTAKNVKITTTTDTSVGSTHALTARFAGDNTNVVNKTFTVHTPANAKLEVIPNTGFIYDYEGNLLPNSSNLNIGNSTFNLGDLNACFEYSLFLSFRFKVVGETPPVETTTLSIDKSVRKATANRGDTTGFSSSVTVDKNERVEYRVVVTNTGNKIARNVTMTDNGVSGITIDRNSVTVGVSDDALLANDLWQGTIPGTINLGDIPAGDSRIIRYTGVATRDNCEALVNTATAVAANAPQVSDSATVNVRCTPAGNPNLTIKKWVKNNSTSTSYDDSSVQARTGERVNFKVSVTNTGNATLNNVRMTDRIPEGLQFDDSVTGDGTPSYNIPTFSVDFGSLTAGQTKTVEFAAKVLATGSTTVCNIAKATGTSVNEVQDDACVRIYTTPKPGEPNIVMSKRAYNDTKGVDATSTTADRGNYITFTLTTTNTGTADAVNYVIRDDLSGVLPLADLIDANGGRVSGNILTYPSITIKPGETVTKTFKVMVKSSLAPTLSYQIKNTYGNTVTINIPGKTVFVAPETGSAATSAGVFAGLITAAFVAVRRGKDIMNFIFA